MILWRNRGQFSILIFLLKIFSPSTVNFRSEVWKFLKKEREIFQKFDFLFDLTRRRLQFSILISLPKSFSPSTGNVRSKFWRLWKEREVSKVLIFDWSFDTKTAKFNFDFLAKTFFAKHGKCSFKNLQNLKKKSEFSNVVFSLKVFLWTRRMQFQRTGQIFSANFRKKFLFSLVHF